MDQNRQSESMWEASRSLKRVQKEQVQPHATSDTVTSESGRASRHRGPIWGTSSQDNPEQPVVLMIEVVFPKKKKKEKKKMMITWSTCSLMVPGPRSHGRTTDGMIGIKMIGNKMGGKVGAVLSFSLQRIGRRMCRT